MEGIRIAWQKGKLIASLKNTPTAAKLLQALPWASSANIEGDPAVLGSIRDGDTITVERVD